MRLPCCISGPISGHIQPLTDSSGKHGKKYVWIKYNFGQKYYAPQVHPTGVRAHDLQIMTAHFMSLRRLL